MIVDKLIEMFRKISGSMSREHSSVDRTMHYYMQGPGFEPRTPHLFTLKKVNSSH